MLPKDDYSPPRDPRGASRPAHDLVLPSFPVTKVKEVDPYKPPAFKIPRKSAPSATAAGRLGDLLSAMMKTSGFTIPHDSPSGVPQAGPSQERPQAPAREKPPPNIARRQESQSGDTPSSNYDSSSYCYESVSQSGDRARDRHGEFPEPLPDSLAALTGFSGLEGFLGVGVQRALPKPSRGLAPQPKAEVLWEHMRGMLTGRDKDHIVKSTEIARKYQSDSAAAFRPPQVPHQIFLDRSEKASDVAMQTKQRSYGIPAHILASLAIDIEQSAIIPLKEAALVSTGVAKQRIEQALEFLQQGASLEIGYALRHLASHFNDWAIKRRDSVLKAKGVTEELAAALGHEKLGFKTFWHQDIAPMVNTANQSASIRMLAQHLKAKAPQRGPAKNANKNAQGGDKKPQQGSNANSGSNQKKKRGGGRGGRGRGKGKGPNTDKDKPKSDK
jgi:hypothetical protein